MPKRLKLTRRFPVAMTEDGYRRLKRFAADSKLEEGEGKGPTLKTLLLKSIGASLCAVIGSPACTALKDLPIVIK